MGHVLEKKAESAGRIQLMPHRSPDRSRGRKYGTAPRSCTDGGWCLLVGHCENTRGDKWPAI